MGLQVIAASAVVITAPIRIGVLIGAFDFML
jgi:hypothetical protein